MDPGRRSTVVVALAMLCGCTEARPTADVVASTGSESEGSGSDSAHTTDSTSSDSTTGGDDAGALPPGIWNGLDVLVVVDDGPTMREEQANIARNFFALARRLTDITDSVGHPLVVDLHIMVTHTSVAGPDCDGDGGMPATTACRDRIEAFVDPALGIDLAEACDEVCPDTVVPAGDFIVSSPDSDNLGAVSAMDLDGDDAAESALARALACIGPQGISGCARGSPLEAMRRALDPEAAWNVATDPFLRDDAALAILFITDGIDCSGVDATTLQDAALWNVDPATGRPAPSEAICWNAAVECDGPDAAGNYEGCVPAAAPLAATSEYAEFLLDLRTSQDKEVLVLGLVGIPLVTEHNVQPPFQPIAGGVHALSVHDFRDAELTPGDAAAGLTAADKQFQLGIGPGCTETDARGEMLGQAIPPIRLIDVCETLDLEGGRDHHIRCCLESVCSIDFAPSWSCLTVLAPMILE